jgi:hypothetical protein
VSARRRSALIVLAVLVVAGLVGAVVLTLPDDDGAGVTGQSDDSFFELRPVTSGEPTNGAPCPAPTIAPDSAVLCDLEGTVVVGMGAVIVDAGDVTSAVANNAGQGQWSVEVTLTDQGADAFADATTQAAEEQPPTNRIAIVVDGAVVSVPEITEPIEDGVLTIGGIDQVAAEQLSSRLAD